MLTCCFWIVSHCSLQGVGGGAELQRGLGARELRRRGEGWGAKNGSSVVQQYQCGVTTEVSDLLPDLTLLSEHTGSEGFKRLT